MTEQHDLPDRIINVPFHFTQEMWTKGFDLWRFPTPARRALSLIFPLAWATYYIFAILMLFVCAFTAVAVALLMIFPMNVFCSISDYIRYYWNTENRPEKRD